MKRENIRSAVLLRQALIKSRKLAVPRKLAGCLMSALCPRDRHSFLRDAEESGVPKDVPRGHLAVYAGIDNCKRFIIPAAYLNHPLLVALLDKAEEVYGFQPQRRLTIPCDDALFHYILRLLARTGASARDSNLDEVVDSFLMERNCAVQERPIEGFRCMEPLIRQHLVR